MKRKPLPNLKDCFCAGFRKPMPPGHLPVPRHIWERNHKHLARKNIQSIFWLLFYYLTSMAHRLWTFMMESWCPLSAQVFWPGRHSRTDVSV